MIPASSRARVCVRVCVANEREERIAGLRREERNARYDRVTSFFRRYQRGIMAMRGPV